MGEENYEAKLNLWITKLCAGTTATSAVRRRTFGSMAMPRCDGQSIWPAERRDGRGDLESLRVKCRLCLERHRRPGARSSGFLAMERAGEVHPVREPRDLKEASWGFVKLDLASNGPAKQRHRDR